MEYSNILYKKSAPIAILSLNRPEIKNAFTLKMAEDIYQALKDASSDPAIKVIIIRGEGNVFSAGGDIKEMSRGKLTSWDMKDYLWNHVQKIPLLLEEIDKPVIASIDGPAFGGGFGLALACDLRIASERATFCATYVRIGLASGDGSAIYLPRLVGFSRAMDIIFTGRVIEMEEAHRLGLVNRVVSAETLEKESLAYAGEIARWPEASLKASKRALYDGLTSDLKGHLDYMSSQLALLSETREHKEAIKALIHKKKT
jgi:enoyl-CoA hydratase/carnithine racemase